MLFDDDDNNSTFGKNQNSFMTSPLDKEPSDLDFMIHNPNVDLWETIHPEKTIDPNYQIRKSFYGGDDWDD